MSFLRESLSVKKILDVGFIKWPYHSGFDAEIRYASRCIVLFSESSIIQLWIGKNLN